MRPSRGRARSLAWRAMDELERAAELINRALDALSIAAVRNPERRADFAAQCERLRLLMEEVETARQSRT